MDPPRCSQALVLFQHLNYSGASRMLSDPPSLCWKSFPSDTVTICFYLYFPLQSQSSGPAFASAEPPPPPPPCSSVTQCSNMCTRDRRLIKVRITVRVRTGLPTSECLQALKEESEKCVAGMSGLCGNLCSSLFIQVALTAVTHTYISRDVFFFAFISFFLCAERKRPSAFRLHRLSPAPPARVDAASMT